MGGWEGFKAVVSDPNAWLFMILYASFNIGVATVSYFLPTVSSLYLYDGVYRIALVLVCFLSPFASALPPASLVPLGLRPFAPPLLFSSKPQL